MLEVVGKKIQILQMKIFNVFMQRFIKIGTVHVIDYLGLKYSYRGIPSSPEITVHLHTKNIVFKLLLNPDLAMGEGYMDGAITIENGSIYDLLLILSINLNTRIFSVTQKLDIWWQQKFKKFMKIITPIVAKSNVRHHYDLPPLLYNLFLDDDWQYSCAYFHNLNNDLNCAQLDKKRHLAAKLLLQPNQTVLDIGCGWGGFALYLAKIQNVRVIGVTLSKEQLRVATQRAKNAGLSKRVQFLLKDYREITGTFDRIVSIGMFEHVGLAEYNTYFKQINKLLAGDGLILLDSIGKSYNAGISSPWINKYIFPGGYIPALSEVCPAIEKEHLHITDIEILHHHYAATLAAWRQKFLINHKKLKKYFDDRFMRMWEYYLSASHISFQNLELMNFQIQIMKNKQNIPLTRDYIYQDMRLISSNFSC